MTARNSFLVARWLAVKAALMRATMMTRRSSRGRMPVPGLEAALDRAEAYREAMDAVHRSAAIDRGNAVSLRQVRWPGAASCQYGRGRQDTIKSADDLAVLGYSIAIFPGGAVRAISSISRPITTGCFQRKNAGFADRMHDFNGLNEIIETTALLERGKIYEDIDSTD